MNELKFALDENQEAESRKKFDDIKKEMELQVKLFEQNCTLCKSKIKDGADKMFVPWCPRCNTQSIPNFYLHGDCKNKLLDWDSTLMFGHYLLPKYANIIVCDKCNNSNVFGFETLGSHMRENLLLSAWEQRN